MSDNYPEQPVESEDKKDVVSSSGQQCSNCGTNKTPLWRRAPDGTLICNACGLYYRSNNCHRPVNLKRPPQMKVVTKDKEGSCKGDGRCNGTGGSAACLGCPAYNNRVVMNKRKLDSDEGDGKEETRQDASVAIACFNCTTTITPLWRRDDAGNTICNACGLYYRLHGSHRPVRMKRATIKRRRRVVANKEVKSPDTVALPSNPGLKSPPENATRLPTQVTSPGPPPQFNLPPPIASVAPHLVKLPPIRLPSIQNPMVVPSRVTSVPMETMVKQEPTESLKAPIINETAPQKGCKCCSRKSVSAPPVAIDFTQAYPPPSSTTSLSINKLLND